MRFLIVAFLVSCALPSYAKGRRTPSADAVFTDEGNSRIPFSVECSSSAWTVLASSDSIRRAALIQAPHFNTYGVCVSSSSGSTPCDNTTNGVELSTGATGASMVDNSVAEIRCRARAAAAGFSPQRLKGFLYRDSEDYGAIDR